MKNTQELKERLKTDIDKSIKALELANEKSWYAQEGVLLTQNEAQLFLELLEREESRQLTKIAPCPTCGGDPCHCHRPMDI